MATVNRSRLGPTTAPEIFAITRVLPEVPPRATNGVVGCNDSYKDST